jgi:hypothetical protein
MIGNQLSSMLWKNWLLKKANFGGFLAEIFLPIMFMVLLIMIKLDSDYYDSPNVAYHCGSVYPFYYSNSINVTSESAILSSIPVLCSQMPTDCTASNYYQETDKLYEITSGSEQFYVAGYSQYGNLCIYYKFE